jgi:hypothetical protein
MVPWSVVRMRGCPRYWGTLRRMESGRALVTFDNGVEEWVDAHAIHPAA